eukprot:c28884_g1_i2 orf=696-2879(+)
MHCFYPHLHFQKTNHSPDNNISRPSKVQDILKETFSEPRKKKHKKWQLRKVKCNGWISERLVKEPDIRVVKVIKEVETSHLCPEKNENGKIGDDYLDSDRREVPETRCLSQNEEKGREMCTEVSQEYVNEVDGSAENICNIIEEESRDPLKSDLSADNADEVVTLEGRSAANATQEANENVPSKISLKVVEPQCDESISHGVPFQIDVTCATSVLAGIVDGDAIPALADSMDARPMEESTAANNGESMEDTKSSACLKTATFSEALLQARNDCFDGKSFPLYGSRLDAHSRWKQLKHTLTLVNHMAENMKSTSKDVLGKGSEVLPYRTDLKEDAGGVGAAAFEGTKTMSQCRLKGRKGMDGLLVSHDKTFITFIQDFYVACLKMPATLFLMGVFLSPVALGLLFTPLYLFDVDGLTFNGVVPEGAATSPLATGKQQCLAIINVFLYALSLSTTFGGSPVAALSPFCLLVANVNTLVSQFLFVFLSGAVFARMSQPSNPIQCSKKAIIKDDDIMLVIGNGTQEKLKAFCVRLVLTGPCPCELLDAKICLTFRIFVKHASGALFCSTQDLELVRPEVSYLRYGLMVRHIINKKSPLYGHTMETLVEGDASFSLTVMGMERASLQPIFHIEDYYVYDGDVLWDTDYADFIHVNEKGQRVLDHSKINELIPLQTSGDTKSKKTSRSRNLEAKSESINKGELSSFLWKGWWKSSTQKRKLFKSKSTSFTDDW